MRLLFYDKYLEAIMQLPKNIQGKVMDLHRKLRDNSKSPAIHLEPISTFIDPKLRTARVGDKYRAIVGVPNQGDVFYLLWVDNHDEAMAWAANKRFEWNEHTQVAQLFEAIQETGTITEQTPEIISTQASLFDSNTDTELLAIGVPPVLLPAVRRITDLNGLDQLEKYIPTDAYENLFYLADGADIRRILDEISEGIITTANTTEAATSVNNQRHFIELTDDELFNQALLGELKKWLFYLHPSQRKLVESSFNGPVKVSGGAGTGKTVSALHRLKHLIEQKNPDRPILFVTYTNALTDNLVKLAADMGIPDGRYLIQTVDSLCVQLAKKIGLWHDYDRLTDRLGSRSGLELWEEMLDYELTEFNADFLSTEYEQVILYHNVRSAPEYYTTSRAGRSKPLTRKQRMEVWRLIDRYEGYLTDQHYRHPGKLFNQVSNRLNETQERPFSHIIADELQDLSNIELRFLRALTETGPNDLFLVGDPLQRIYDRKVNFTQAGINIRGNRSRRLRVNYRTTEEIKRYALAVIKNDQFDDFDGGAETSAGYVSLLHGAKPTYQVFGKKEQEITNMLEQIDACRQGGLSYADIVIASRTRDGLKDFKRSLHNEHIPYYDYTSPGKTNDPLGIRLCTFHSMKGLEFKVVLLVDVNDRTLPIKPQGFERWEALRQKEYLQEQRSLLYVAATRAIQKVCISGTGRSSEWLVASEV